MDKIKIFLYMLDIRSPRIVVVKVLLTLAVASIIKLIYRRKLKKTNKKQTDLVLPLSPKVGLGNNCPMLNV